MNRSATSSKAIRIRPIVLCVLLLLAACGASESLPSRVLNTTLVPRPRQAREIPPGALEPRLRAFLVDAMAGRLTPSRLAGDRLLVLTSATFSEIAARDVLRLNGVTLSFGYGCPDVCTTELSSLLEIMLADLDNGAPFDGPLATSVALSQWPSHSFSYGDRLWRATFDDDGDGLLAIELFGNFPDAAKVATGG